MNLTKKALLFLFVFLCRPYQAPCQIPPARESTIGANTISGNFDTTAYFFHNLDFKDYNGQSPASIAESDDLTINAFSLVNLLWQVRLSGYTAFFMEVFFLQQWGANSSAYLDPAPTPAKPRTPVFPQLYGTVRFAGDPASLTLFMGKKLHTTGFSQKTTQRNTIFSASQQNFYYPGNDQTQPGDRLWQADYVFYQPVEGIFLEYFHPERGRLEALFSVQSNVPQEYNGFGGGAFAEDSREAERTGSNYRGDLPVVRTGLLYQSPRLKKQTARLEQELEQVIDKNIESGFLFYLYLTRYGAVRGGRERASQTPNHADEDYILVSGGRAYYRFQRFSGEAQAAASDGVDRKLPNYEGYSRDALASGAMGGVTLSMDYQLKRRNNSVMQTNLPANFPPNLQAMAQIELFYFEGITFDDYGNLTSTGFTGFGGEQAGGYLMTNIAGFYPAAFGQNNGIYHSSRFHHHASGISFGHFRNILTINPLSLGLALGLDIWVVYDQSVNDTRGAVSFDGKPQNRSGEKIGEEADLSLLYRRKWHSFYLVAAVFRPGDFYPESDLFTGLFLGSRLLF